MNLGELITQYCGEHGISNQGFAKICGYSKAYISMLINNRNPKTGKPIQPSVETYSNIARAMGMTIDQLFEAIDDAPVALSSPDKNELISMDELNEDEIRFVKAFSALSPSNRRILFALAQVLQQEQEEPPDHSG